jgi:dTDP-glucose 4,6-dehydratase
MERVLLTGSTGFIGSHLAPILLEKGYDVCCLNRFASNRLVHNFGQKILLADLMDYDAVCRTVEYFEPEAVIHLAAVSPVGYSYDHPIEVNTVNYLGTINLAEACKNIAGFKQFIFAGTSEAYGNQESFPIPEDAEYYPNSPYSASKSAAIRYLEYMGAAYGFPYSIALPFNTYGRINSKHFVTESLATQMLDHEREVVKFGDPKPVRDFLFRDDHVNAYVSMLGNPDALGEKFNFCTGRGVTIQELIDILLEVTGFEGTTEPYHYPRRPLDIDTLIGDNTKAQILLDWTPKYTLEAGLQKTVNELALW